MHKHKYWREQEWQHCIKQRKINGRYWTHVKFLYAEDGEFVISWFEPPICPCKAVKVSFRNNRKCHKSAKKISTKQVRRTQELLQGNKYRKVYDLWYNEW